MAVLVFWAAHRLGFFEVIQDWFAEALGWVEGLGPVGPVLFIAIYIVATVLLLPASVLTLDAGAVGLGKPYGKG
ncbi:hypothetical protein NW841_04830 [Synechococcus sp. H60.3]|uniref:hypothetical protein n=1 Tax=Synechococcus sp. H60.3 TaxID=2967124 RepID=UPI0039C0FB49